MVVPGNGVSLVVLLLKTLIGDWAFSGMNTQDLTVMVRPDDDYVRARFPSWSRRFGEHFQSIVIVTIGGSLAAACL
jgi:hypothetical protein